MSDRNLPSSPVEEEAVPAATPPRSDSEENNNNVVFVPEGMSGKWNAVKEVIARDDIEDLDPVQFTEKGEVVGDPTMHPEVKDAALPKSLPPLTKPAMLVREDSSQRSGLLRFKGSATIFFTSKWRESYVNVDPQDGIRFCKDLESFRAGKFEKILNYSDVKSVEIDRPGIGGSVSNLVGCVFRVNVIHGSIGARTFGKVLFLRAESESEAESWVHDLQTKLSLTARVYTVGLNGEFPENSRGVRPGTAICFSGGGGRAHVCACGQLRALNHLNLLEKKTIDYMSGVSAGAWATAIFTFYEKGASSDVELFGAIISDKLSKLNMKGLERSLAPIFQPAEKDMWKAATELVWKTNPHELWEAAMSNLFLKPFGLSHHFPFAMREDVERIKAENPHLAHQRFHVTRSTTRPFWVAHGTIVGPQWARVHDMLPIQFTPIYTGSPYLHKMHYYDIKHPTASKDLWVGGGMVDSFAFGGEEPTAMDKNGLRPNFVGEKKPWLSKLSYPSHVDTSIPAPMSEQSRAFGFAVQEMALKARGVRPSASSHGLDARGGDDDVKAMEDAMVSMRLGPHMIQRVFKYAKDKFAVLEQGFDGVPQGVLDGQDGVLERKVLLPHPSVHFSLRHALAISSDAPSVNMHNRQLFKRLNVQQRYWTPVALQTAGLVNDATSMALTHATTMDMGDGGSLDNTGLLGMMQRGVRKCIVFLNTVNQIPVPGTTFHRGSRVSLSNYKKAPRSPTKTATPTSPTSGEANFSNEQVPPSPTSSGAPDSSVSPPPSNPNFAASQEAENGDHPFPSATADHDPNAPPQWDEWPDEDILPLFGQKVDEQSLNYLGTHHANNHVFPEKGLRPLLLEFQELFAKGRPLCVEAKYQVLENAFWGIEGGWEIEIMWMYLEDAHNFNSALPKDVRHELKKNEKGEFCRFPNYLTFGQQSGKIQVEIALSRRQINLLSAFTEWQVMENKDRIIKFLENVPAVVRKRKNIQTCINVLECEIKATKATIDELSNKGYA